MRRFNILFAFAAILLSSCINDEVDYIGYQPSSKGGIHIVGAVEDYDIKSVGTRADDGDIADSYISEMTMFIFKGNGDLIQGYTDATFTTKCTSAINIQRGNPTFLIDTEEGILADLSGTSDTSVVYYNNNANDLGACDIYIVANAWHQLSAVKNGSRPVDAIETLADLEAFVYQADATLAMPMIKDENGTDKVCGFPMIGKQQGGSFKLNKGADNEGNAVATIPLKKLYSKVRFTMQINADQVVAGQTPKFTISQVEVFNVPKKARLGRRLKDDGSLNYDIDYLKEIANIESTSTPSDYYYCTNTADPAAKPEDAPFVIDQFNKTTIYHSTSLTTDDIIEFGFYMPEHKVTPNKITYPANITEEAKQYYKPTGVGAVRNGDGTTTLAKIATFVRIHGSYTDHNGQILGVSYDIYLGQNNSDDFTVKRNQLLNNKLIITGLTNHKDAYPDAEGNISIDHRVEVSDRGFNLSMERTAILDAHFEVRPLDIELSPNSQMTITIPEEYRSWIAMEDDAAARSGVNSNLYVNTTAERKGVRKYFTTNLVSELNTANGGTITIANNDSGATATKTFRIWFYIDENPNVYDKTGATTPNSDVDGTYSVSKEQYRVCPVKFKYMGTDKDGNTMTKEEKINFQQWNLWRVWAKDANGNPVRYYDIEHEEEYLNNYASDQKYGETQNGMAWGLNDIQLSYEFQSLYAVQSGGSGLGAFIDAIGSIVGAKTAEEFANVALSEKGVSPKYDFYLTRDIQSMPSQHQDKFKKFDYSGLYFSSRIAKYLRANYPAHQQGGNSDATIDRLKLTDDPNSALAYSLNKNKRNTDGTLDLENIKWYLPAIDEIEEIAKAAYDEFDRVFQNNLYWSSQPAFTQNELNVTKIGNALVNYGKLTGTFYEDDKYRARSTFVYTNDGGNSWIPCSSEAPEITKTISGEITYWKITSSISFDDLKTTTKTITDYTSTPGNKARTDKCRIRAVYRSGTK